MKPTVDQLLGIGMIAIMTVLFWGDWTTMAFLYIPFVGVLMIIHLTKWWLTHRSKS